MQCSAWVGYFEWLAAVWLCAGGKQAKELISLGFLSLVASVFNEWSIVKLMPHVAGRKKSIEWNMVGTTAESSTSYGVSCTVI